ncbi:DUF4389 domain-containing protein [Blastococcus tunisiensis]|uniref:DUF4389 domain-containing protein n=1 Tax=Blastococcus tunisiensis TaxID=1798228 RepID=A0A1I2E0W3_9ACTN|nr:DUF4389 domain-containing protein [Blastococcus sp. DSM 46838]SFE86329.1 protein of unknown function [Blastococcus sp. DSM 46838]
MPDDPTYPVRVDASPDPSPSRGLWLVKWLLLLPHYVVLTFLWIAFVVVTVVAFVAILVTGRYPRVLFDFSVGVLRWSWRVHYYGYAALGTDRYPPFTLADVPDYPAHLDVAYPERLSRGLVLVKWWLLALPHYLVVAVFAGGGVWLTTRGGDGGGYDDGWGAGGLIGLLVLVAGIVLLFTGRYPRGLYDFVLGMDRWVIRVAAYAGLMTDRYPPFRMDMGGRDPGSRPAPPVPPAPVGGATAAGTGTAAGGWTGGRTVAVVMGSVLLFLSTGLLAGGGALLWADRTQRDDGYVMSGWADLSSPRHAVAGEGVELETGGSDWVIDDFLGTARLEVRSDDGRDLFVGVARTRDADEYLDGVGHGRLAELGPGWDGRRTGPATMDDVAGGPPAVPPGESDIWVAQSTGPGTQVLDWRPADGTWTVVVMRADGARGIDAEARVGATAPGLPWLAGGLLGTGALLALAGGLLVVLAVHRARQGPPAGGIPAQRTPPPSPAGAYDAPVAGSRPGDPT